MSYLTTKNITTVLSIFISFIFIQSMFFKFSGAPETVHIFGTIADWMASNFLVVFSEPFRSIGAYGVGIVELIASIFLLHQVFHRIKKQPTDGDAKKTIIGSLLAFVTISGAIFFHLFTPLGIDVQGDGGALFYSAVGIWVAALVLMYLHRNALKQLCN